MDVNEKVTVQHHQAIKNNKKKQKKTKNILVLFLNFDEKF